MRECAFATTGTTNMEILSTIQENLKFRMNSFQAMIMGSSDVAEAEPLNRRREIMRRRREAAKSLTGSSDDNDVESSSKKYGSSSDTSGSIGDPGASSSSSNGGTVTARTPSMSDINRGTLERAREQGYSG